MASLFNQKNMRTRLARAYFESGSYEKALDLVTKFQGRERMQFRQAEFRAHYRLGVQRCAENNFVAGHQHFSEAVQLAADSSDLQLCQARLQTLNHLLLTPSPPLPDSIKDRRHNCPACSPEKSFYDCAVCEYIQAIHKVQKLPPDALQPHLDAVYAVGAYRRWWDRQQNNPYSQAVKRAQQEESEILLEPLGILLADFISNGEAQHLRQEIDFICPIPSQDSSPDAWRNQALGIIGRVISRRFGIPLFSVLQATGRRKNSNRRSNRPHESRRPFQVRDLDLVYGRNILLLDDIATYRKTIGEAGSLLRDAGARTVFGVILAYTESS